MARRSIDGQQSAVMLVALLRYKPCQYSIRVEDFLGMVFGPPSRSVTNSPHMVWHASVYAKGIPILVRSAHYKISFRKCTHDVDVS